MCSISSFFIMIAVWLFGHRTRSCLPFQIQYKEAKKSSTFELFLLQRGNFGKAVLV